VPATGSECSDCLCGIPRWPRGRFQAPFKQVEIGSCLMTDSRSFCHSFMVCISIFSGWPPRYILRAGFRFPRFRAPPGKRPKLDPRFSKRTFPFEFREFFAQLEIFRGLFLFAGRNFGFQQFQLLFSAFRSATLTPSCERLPKRRSAGSTVPVSRPRQHYRTPPDSCDNHVRPAPAFVRIRSSCFSISNTLRRDSSVSTSRMRLRKRSVLCSQAERPVPWILARLVRLRNEA